MTTFYKNYSDAKTGIQGREKEIKIENMSSADIDSLAELLKTNDSLTSLNITDIEISDEDAKVIAEALKKNTTLTSLIIDHYNKPIAEER